MNIRKQISLFVLALSLIVFNSDALQAQTITTATNGIGISADNVGGAYTTLTGPQITETSAGQLSLGFIDLTVPSGFEWNTAVTPTVTVTLAPGLNGKTKLQASFISITASTVRIQITQASDNGGNRAGRITLGNLQVRPTSGVFPNAGNITNSGTTGPAASTNYGSLSIVKGAASQIRVETADDGTGSIVAAQNLTAGNSLTAYSISRDQFGNFLENIAADSWSVITPTNDLDLNADLNVAVDSKSVSFSSNIVGTGKIQATYTNLSPIPSNTITVVHAAPTSLELQTQTSTTATAGVVFGQQPVIRIVDVYGNTITSDLTSSIKATISLGEGVIQGDTSVTVVQGVATFSNLSHNVANSIKLKFSSPGFSDIESTDFTVVSAAAATALEFAIQPPNGSRNNLLSPSPEVQIIDAYGNNVSQASTAITMTILTGSGIFTNGSTLVVNTDGTGKAVFSNLALKTNDTYTFEATSPSLTSAISEPFQIVSAGSLSNFIVEISGGGDITTQTAGESFDLQITAVDGVGNILDGGGSGNNQRDNFNGKAFIEVPGNTGTGINDSLSFVSGSATTSITLETAGNFSVTASRLAISTESNSFDVVPNIASPNTSTVNAVPTSIVANGVSQALISVQLFDQYGNVLTSGGDGVVINTDAGTLLGSVTDNGNGTYERFLESSTTVETATITASVNGDLLTSNDLVEFIAGGLDHFKVEAAGGGTIGSQEAGVAFDILITAQDEFDNTVTSFDGSVTITSNKSAASGMGSISLTNGVIDNYSVNLTESGISDATISATNTSGSQTGTSNSFTIDPGAIDPATTTITPANRFIENTGSTTTLITVQAKDEFGNNLLSGGSSISLLTTAGTLQGGSVTDVGDGTYTQTLQSSTSVEQAIITGSIGATAITDNASIFFTQFNEWISSGGGGSNPTKWSRGSNWTLGTPTSDQAVIIPTTPTGATKFPILDTSPTIAFLEVESGASVNADPGFSITITNDLTGEGSLILDNTSATIGGNISISNLNAGNSSVILNGTDLQTLDGDLVSDVLTISNTGDGVLVNQYINADTQLEISGSSILTLASGTTMEVYNDLIGTGTLNATNANILIGGDISLTDADFTTSDLTLNGTIAQTITPDFSYKNLNISNTSGTNVIIDNNASISNTLSLISGTLQINGDLTSNIVNGSTGSLSLLGNVDISTVSPAPVTVSFEGTDDQSINSFDEFNGLIVNKSSGELNANTDIIVNGTLTLSQGDLVIGSGLNLLAPNRTITSGQIRFLRELTSQGWYLLSSPVDTDFDNFLDGTLTQGYSGSTLGVEYLDVPGDSLQPNVLFYKESELGTDLDRWRYPVSSTEDVSAGTGYFVYAFGNVDGDARYNDPLPDTLDVGGTEFDGDGSTLDFGVTYTASADTGWNLIGNPFGATLNWDAGNWTKNDIDNTIYVWDKTANNGNGEYLVWNGITGSLGSGLIAPFQGFWVKANTIGASLIADLDDKTTGGVFRKTNPNEKNRLEDLVESPVIGFTLRTDGLEKESFIMFSEEGLVGKDSFDAYQLEPFTDSYLELYTKHKDGSPLVINHLPRKFGKEIEIPIYLDAFKNGAGISGSFEINLSSLENIPESWVLTLENSSNGNEKVIQLGESIDFTFSSTFAKSKASGYKVKENKQRSNPQFILKIEPGDDAFGLPAEFELGQNYPNPFNPSTTFVFDLPVQSPVTLEVYDILGRKVTSVIQNTTYQAGSYEVPWNASSLASGIYLYRIVTSEGVKIKKMTLIK